MSSCLSSCVFVCWQSLVYLLPLIFLAAANRGTWPEREVITKMRGKAFGNGTRIQLRTSHASFYETGQDGIADGTTTGASIAASSTTLFPPRDFRELTPSPSPHPPTSLTLNGRFITDTNLAPSELVHSLVR